MIDCFIWVFKSVFTSHSGRVINKSWLRARPSTPDQLSGLREAPAWPDHRALFTATVKKRGITITRLLLVEEFIITQPMERQKATTNPAASRGALLVAPRSEGRPGRRSPAGTRTGRQWHAAEAAPFMPGRVKGGGTRVGR